MVSVHLWDMSPIDDFLRDTLNDWAIQFIRNRIADLRSRKLVASQELIKSFEYEVSQTVLNGVASVYFEFNDYGRIQDMRGRRPGSPGPEGIERLKDWIQQKGVQSFRAGLIRRYGRAPKNLNSLLNQVAWGIARGKKKPKRRRWYSKGREADIQALYDRLFTGYAENTLNELKQSIISS